VRIAVLQAFRKGLPIVVLVAAMSILFAVLHGQRVTLSLIGEDIGGATTGVALCVVQKAVARFVRLHRIP
jgi:hypothetical protein